MAPSVHQRTLSLRSGWSLTRGTLLKQERQGLSTEEDVYNDRLMQPVIATVFALRRPKTVNQSRNGGQLS